MLTKDGHYDGLRGTIECLQRFEKQIAPFPLPLPGAAETDEFRAGIDPQPIPYGGLCPWTERMSVQSVGYHLKPRILEKCTFCCTVGQPPAWGDDSEVDVGPRLLFPLPDCVGEVIRVVASKVWTRTTFFLIFLHDFG
jgi:hypothetical protein